MRRLQRRPTSASRAHPSRHAGPRTSCEWSAPRRSPHLSWAQQITLRSIEQLVSAWALTSHSARPESVASRWKLRHTSAAGQRVMPLRPYAGPFFELKLLFTDALPLLRAVGLQPFGAASVGEGKTRVSRAQNEAESSHDCAGRERRSSTTKPPEGPTGAATACRCGLAGERARLRDANRPPVGRGKRHEGLQATTQEQRVASAAIS
jgi:hypothetical protein